MGNKNYSIMAWATVFYSEIIQLISCILLNSSHSWLILIFFWIIVLENVEQIKLFSLIGSN